MWTKLEDAFGDRLGHILLTPKLVEHFYGGVNPPIEWIKSHIPAGWQYVGKDYEGCYNFFKRTSPPEAS